MTVEELNPYFGIRCHVRLRCRGCGGAHVLNGTPRRSRYVGDFTLKGHTFNVEDVEQAWPQADPPRRRGGARLWLGGTLLRGAGGHAASMRKGVLSLLD
jgi:hypothetical protein